METVVKKLYEAMFLVDSAEAAADWDGVIETIEKLLEKAEAEIVSIRKWDERRLAYEIKGCSRGTYILCYFRVNGEEIGGIERDVQLSERIMRVLILCAEAVSQEDVDKDTPAMRAEKQRQESAEKAEAKQTIAREAKAAEESKQLAKEPGGDKGRLGTAEPAATDASKSEQVEVEDSERTEAEDTDKLEL